MSGRRIAVTPSAYAYPLLIKQLLHTPLAQTAHQEIVYRDVRRLTYLELRDRVGRLASALQKIGVRPGDSVGVLDWDSNRFLEAFFAIPMMGVVLQTVNVRLSPEQVAYTIDDAGSSTLLVNDEFVELVQSILPQLSKVKRLVVLTDRKAPATGKLEFAGEYEQLLAAASPDFDFPDFDENVQATTFYTTGTTGQRLGAGVGAGRGPSARWRRQKAVKRPTGAPSALLSSHGSRMRRPLKLRASTPRALSASLTRASRAAAPPSYRRLQRTRLAFAAAASARIVSSASPLMMSSRARERKARSPSRSATRRAAISPPRPADARRPPPGRGYRQRAPDDLQRRQSPAGHRGGSHRATRRYRRLRSWGVLAVARQMLAVSLAMLGSSYEQSVPIFHQL